MDRKATRVEYDPYTSNVSFRVAQSVDGPWEELSEGSGLLKYMNCPILFSNCVANIVSLINDRHNSVPEGLEIQFYGPDDDYAILERVVKRTDDQQGGTGPLSCRHMGTYRTVNETLEIIRRDYAAIEDEFSSYLPGSEYYESTSKAIGDTIVKFEDTISDAVPVCVIGNYSVGKSALINALIGEEVLPSKVNPSTAKNVKVVRSERYAITLSYTDETGKAQSYVFSIEKTGLAPESEDIIACDLAKKLNDRIDSSCDMEIAVARNVLNILNQDANLRPENEFLEHCGSNVVLEMPFDNSLLGKTGSRIEFFDTPGSDNAEVDQKEHKEALAELLGHQTNALPILVTSRDRVVGDDNDAIMRMLDEYANNFASPSCLIVISKCDRLAKAQLDEPVSTKIKNWHGKSIILYVTQIGALGARKGPDASWFDESYEEFYEEWKDKQSGTRRVSLPEHNTYPCDRQVTAEDMCVDQQLFDTGIPSLEYEIQYYVEHYSKYKKSARGRKDLLDALTVVKEELDQLKKDTAKKKEEAEQRKAKKKAELLKELDSLRISIDPRLAARLEQDFENDLDAYCAGLNDAFGELYDAFGELDNAELDNTSGQDNLPSLDGFANERIRDHCQVNLVDKVYLSENGAQARILASMVGFAEDYAKALQEYVAKNESHFTEVGRKQLRECLEQNSSLPEFGEVNSVLGNYHALFDKIASAKHAWMMFAKNADEAREKWAQSKAKYLEQRLRNRTSLLGNPVPGVFSKTVFDEPIGEYSKKLREWADDYKKGIIKQLDSDNVILSDMEDEIASLEVQVSDLKTRLDNMSDVERELNTLLDRMER